MQEDHPSIDYRERSLLRQPGNAMFIVLDQAILENAAPITVEPAAKYRARFGRHPAFVKAKTLAELARILGVPVAHLRRTVLKESRIRHAPRLRFVLDDSLKRSAALESAMREAAGDAGNTGEESD